MGKELNPLVGQGVENNLILNRDKKNSHNSGRRGRGWGCVDEEQFDGKYVIKDD